MVYSIITAVVIVVLILIGIFLHRKGDKFGTLLFLYVLFLIIVTILFVVIYLLFLLRLFLS